MILIEIQIKDLTFAYQKENILENINLTISHKDFLAIIGPNGGGKSTLLKLILGINEIQKGSIEVSSSIGYVPQNTNINTLFPIKVIEVVIMGHIKEKRQLFGYSKNEIKYAMDSLKQVGMEEYANSKIGSLSGGQRQRVMIARALYSNPKIILLDEPTSSIDVNGQKQIYNLLKELNKTITIIVVSHDISVILGFASKVAYINKTLTFHDSQIKKDFDIDNEHFCEVELLQMLNSNPNKNCQC
jgi:zinc transport system ATP-binding protein